MFLYFWLVLVELYKSLIHIILSEVGVLPFNQGWVLHVVTASIELRRDPWIWKKRLQRWWGWKWAIPVCTQGFPCINIVLALKLDMKPAWKGGVHGLKGSQLLKKQQQRVLAVVQQPKKALDLEKTSWCEIGVSCCVFSCALTVLFNWTHRFFKPAKYQLTANACPERHGWAVRKHHAEDQEKARYCLQCARR